jgi:hypothetical protein
LHGDFASGFYRWWVPRGSSQGCHGGAAERFALTVWIGKLLAGSLWRAGSASAGAGCAAAGVDNRHL